MVEDRKQAKLIDLQKYRKLIRDVKQKLKLEIEAYRNVGQNERYTQHLRRLSCRNKSTNGNIQKASSKRNLRKVITSRLMEGILRAAYNHDSPENLAALESVGNLHSKNFLS
ncbi:uncharacterized protein LOC143204160 [Rhynchophorus ferrugineus]|uniref:uncharacterized protein LOC143204160 n=1 Tax=Rhynchophorus ferrugineus TaxID=354439 RepID=UPI003FCE5D2F